MNALDVQEQARVMMASRGQKAIAEAAQKAVRFEQQGQESEARVWRRIEAALIQLAGPRAT